MWAYNAFDRVVADTHSTIDAAKAPEKLRCPQCPRLLIDAYKASCCDVVVCENCTYRGRDRVYVS